MARVSIFIACLVIPLILAQLIEPRRLVSADEAGLAHTCDHSLARRVAAAAQGHVADVGHQATEEPLGLLLLRIRQAQGRAEALQQERAARAPFVKG
jgi:hypothetical protein